MIANDRAGVDNAGNTTFAEPAKQQKPGEAEMVEANALVNGDRQAAYGSPRKSYESVALVWSGLLWDKLSAPLTPEDAALMMAALKLQREAHQHKHDNIVDAHGYLLVLSHVRDGQ